MTDDREAPRSQKGWKDFLLRSGVPLEYEVALCFASEGMPVDADFSFMRRDVSGFKQWSVDIAATWYGPSENKVSYVFEALVECKYRSPQKCVLFLEEPNPPDLSPGILGHTVNQIDAFVPYNLPGNAFTSLEETYPFVYKGVDLYDRGAVEEDLRHGIEQLRYATPALVRNIFDHNMSSHRDDLKPIFLTKILVTNAPLRILNWGTSMEAIKTASDISDISREVSTVIMFSDYGPDFEDHFQSIFKPNLDKRIQTAETLAAYLKNLGKRFKFESEPTTLVRHFSEATRRTCIEVSTQFFITTLDGLRPLLRLIKETCHESYRARRKPRSRMRR